MGSLEVLFLLTRIPLDCSIFSGAVRKSLESFAYAEAIPGWKLMGKQQAVLSDFNVHICYVWELLVLNETRTDGEEISLSFQMIINDNTFQPFNPSLLLVFNIKMNYSHSSECCNELKPLHFTIKITSNVSMCLWKLVEFWLQESSLPSLLLVEAHVKCR